MMMEEPKDSYSTATPNETATCTAAEDAAANASTDEVSRLVSPSGHEASIDLRRSKLPSSSISDQDGTASEVNGTGDVRQTKEGPGFCESSLNVQSSATGTDGGSVLGSSILYPHVAVSEKDIYSSPPSSSSIESSRTSYTSFEPLIDEPWGKNNLRRYDSDSEETEDENHLKNVDKGKGKEIDPRIPDQGPIPAAEGQQSQPLNNIVPWVQDPERPPQKFPIRFTDCVGRNFVWPWKKAQTWKVS